MVTETRYTTTKLTALRDISFFIDHMDMMEWATQTLG